MLTEQQLDFLNIAAGASVATEQTSKVPAELSLIQAIDESGWGVHAPGNNIYGIKAVPGEAYTRKMTEEYINGQMEYVEQDFAAYPSLADAFAAHAELISQGTYFKAAFEQYESDRDIPALIRNVAEHYATDPNYADKLLAILRMPSVQSAISVARQN